MDLNHSRAFVLGCLCVTMFSSSHTAFGAPNVDPCSLLTPAQVSAVLGVDVGAGQRLVPTLCGWSATAQSKMGTPKKKVSLTLQNPQAFAYAKMPAGNGITKTPVGGIGDDAVYGTTAKVATTLTVKKGNTVFTVRVYGLDETKDIDEIKAKEKTLALEILSKL